MVDSKPISPLPSGTKVVNPDGTPTQFFQRWAQDRGIDIGKGVTAAQVQDLIDQWGAAHTVTAGTGLSGGGTIKSDPSISLHANLSNLLDVDESTAPTDGQALVYDLADNVWKPGTVSGGGGGGGSVTPPTVVQLASLRDDGTVTLPAAPTVGNVLIFVAAGYQGSLQSYVPGGFNLYDDVQSDGNNGVLIAYRYVQAGDPAGWNVSAGDNQACTLYEMSGVGGIIRQAGGGLGFSGNNFTLNLFGPLAPSVGLVVFEQDNSNDWTINPATGLTVDYISASSGGNHTGAFTRLDPTTFAGAITGSVSGSGPSSPAYALWYVYGR